MTIPLATWYCRFGEVNSGSRTFVRLPAADVSPAAPAAAPAAALGSPRWITSRDSGCARLSPDYDGIHRFVLARQGNLGEARGH